MLFNLKIQKPQNNEFIQPRYMTDSVFLWFVESLKAQQSYNLVYLQQNQAKVQERPSPLSQNKIKTMLSLQKKHRFIQMLCYGQIIRNQGKSLDKNMLEGLQKLNQLQHYQLLAIKVFYDVQRKLITAQSHIYEEMIITITKQQLCQRFLLVVKELFKIVREFENMLIQKENQRQLKIAYQISKLKQIFQENRIRRPKSTKICLLAKSSDKIVSKVVMNYLAEIKRNTPFARELYAKFREKSSRFEKQQNENMKKLNELVQSRRTRQIFPNSGELKNCSTVLVKPMVLQNQIFLENLEQGGFGQVQKYKCTYSQLLTCCVESQKLIEDYWVKNNLKVQKKQVTEVLVKKVPLNSDFGLSSFRIEVACLNYLRNQQCEQIAQYYNPVNLYENEKNEEQQFGQSKSLYSKYYELGLSDYERSDADFRIKIIQDLLEGIRFLIKFNVLHRDLKPSNIKMTQKGKIKIIDFGSACLNYSQEKINPKFCYSPMYTLEYAKAHLSHISQHQFTSHQFYDLYAYGKIVENFFSKNQGDAGFLLDNLKYLSEKCMEHNPEDRLHPTQGLVFLQTLLKVFHVGYQK